MSHQQLRSNVLAGGTSVGSTAGLVRAAPAEVAVRRVTPIKWFAAAGCASWLLETYLFIRWIASGPTRTPTGSDHVPEYMKVAVTAAEISSPLLFSACVAWLIVRPWRQKRKVGVEGILCIAILANCWQDLAFNYFNPAIAINTQFVNLGSWYGFIPGWASPRANHLAEPFLFSVPVFVWGMVPPAIGVAALMRRAKARWPAIGTLGLCALALVFTAVVDAVLEIPFSHLGLYTYVGSLPAFTLFAGHYYQFPIYEAILFGAEMAAIASLFYFKDDRGNTIAERGVERLGRTPRQEGVFRFLALSGYSSATWLLYNIAFAMITLFPSFTWATDVAHHRSYLRDELCGAGTTYACPSGTTPIPRVGGAHVAPDGSLVVPNR